MKAIRIERTGGLEVLEYVDVPTPATGRSDVLVKAHAIGVNMHNGASVDVGLLREDHAMPQFSRGDSAP